MCAHFFKFHEPMCFLDGSFNSVLDILFVSVLYQDLDPVHQMIGSFSSEQDHLVITLLSMDLPAKFARQMKTVSLCKLFLE